MVKYREEAWSSTMDLLGSNIQPGGYAFVHAFCLYIPCYVRRLSLFTSFAQFTPKIPLNSTKVLNLDQQIQQTNGVNLSGKQNKLRVHFKNLTKFEGVEFVLIF